MSNFAFGTYRVTDLNTQHIEALKEAIRSGITMIDTSSNYMDGGAERAIAKVFRELDPSLRDKVEIVSKFGYIQGESLQKYKKKIAEYDQEVVKYSDECYHSISKEFMRKELAASLERLEVQKIDCYLIHNPEYYLLDAIKRGVPKEDRLDEIYRRVQEVFVALEEEVKNGRVGSYGISSNGFSLSSRDDEFFPYEDLLTLAQNAASIVQNSIHSFTTIQLPINILEVGGLACASWAKKSGLRVLANRPFNAKYNGKMYRLCDYDESRDYYYYLNELMEVCNSDRFRPLYNLIEQLDLTKHRFAWIGDYDLFLVSQILPYMKKTLELLDEKELELILNYIDLYLQEYKKMVSFECSKNTRTELGEFFYGCHSTMQECAIKFLIESDLIDYIIVGMRKPSYVDEILSLK